MVKVAKAKGVEPVRGSRDLQNFRRPGPDRRPEAPDLHSLPFTPQGHRPQGRTDFSSQWGSRLGELARLLPGLGSKSNPGWILPSTGPPLGMQGPHLQAPRCHDRRGGHARKPGFTVALGPDRAPQVSRPSLVFDKLPQPAEARLATRQAREPAR